MDVYKFSFGVLTVANGALCYLSSRKSRSDGGGDQKEGGDPLVEKSQYSDHDVQEFQRSFFLVYAFVVAADWLQGPYMYALYKDEKGQSEPVVAMLFAIGFVSAAVSASFVGDLADSHGRKYACLCFCAIYSASCLSTVFNSLTILFVGRICGGVSTTLLFSVFETWMVSEYHARAMREKGLDLSLMFGRMTTVSSIVAIVAGVVGQLLVDRSGTKVAPFIASVVCLCVAALLINTSWAENYGSKAKLREDGSEAQMDIKTIIQDKKIVSLGLICCLFEGTMYLFVFFWSAALKSARAATTTATTATTSSASASAPPFGLVFATFMNAMMFGSLLFTATGHAFTVPTVTQTLTLVIVLAAASLLAIVQVNAESLTLWAFCLFEACVGMYYPSMGYLKGQLVHDGIRGKVYSLLRLPLNLFVVVTLGLTKEGDQHRDNIFLACSGLLIVAYLVCQRYLVTKA